MVKDIRHVVKRGGHYEAFDERKLYASIYSAALAVREYPGAAELIAQNVTEEIEKWIVSKHEITSVDIRHQVAKILEVLNPDAAYIYAKHKGLHT